MRPGNFGYVLKINLSHSVFCCFPPGRDQVKAQAVHPCQRKKLGKENEDKLKIFGTKTKDRAC
jgi:hypothetical protein